MEDPKKINGLKGRMADVFFEIEEPDEATKKPDTQTNKESGPKRTKKL
jgi:hypothetical protein